MVRYTANGCPSEDDEESVLADYCDLRGWKHTHFSNETWTPSHNQKRKMQKLGVHSGLPDHLILMPRKGGKLLPVYIEMKRKKDGTISDSQFNWIQALRLAGQTVAVCEGGDEAIEYLEAIEHGLPKQFEIEEKFDKKYEKWLKKQEKRKNSCPF